jgi:ribonuclease HII
MNGPECSLDVAKSSTDKMGQLEIWAYERGYERIAGVDEVGRGPLAGPVVAAAVMLPRNHDIQGLNDSKKLSSQSRERLAKMIRERAEGLGIGLVEPGRIDSINIREAALEAMALAFGGLVDRAGPPDFPDLVLVDGMDRFALPSGFSSVFQQPFTKADARSEAVAAASIIAKVHRDAIMLKYHLRWPQYGFDRHKGYPTKSHKQAILEHGTCARIERLPFFNGSPPNQRMAHLQESHDALN